MTQNSRGFVKLTANLLTHRQFDIAITTIATIPQNYFLQFEHNTIKWLNVC